MPRHERDEAGEWSFRAKLKSGRVDVASRVFDTRREAQAWLNRERAAVVGGVDPRAGRERVRRALAMVGGAARDRRSEDVPG